MNLRCGVLFFLFISFVYSKSVCQESCSKFVPGCHDKVNFGLNFKNYKISKTTLDKCHKKSDFHLTKQESGLTSAFLWIDYLVGSPTTFESQFRNTVEKITGAKEQIEAVNKLQKIFAEKLVTPNFFKCIQLVGGTWSQKTCSAESVSNSKKTALVLINQLDNLYKKEKNTGRPESSCECLKKSLLSGKSTVIDNATMKKLFTENVMKKCQNKCSKQKIVRAGISRQSLCDKRNNGLKEKTFFLINLPTTVRGMRNGKLVSKKLRYHQACLRITPRLKRHIANAYKFVGKKPKTVYELIVGGFKKATEKPKVTKPIKPTKIKITKVKDSVSKPKVEDTVKMSDKMSISELAAIREGNIKKYEQLLAETKKQKAETKYKTLLQRIEVLMDRQNSYYKEINNTDKLLRTDHTLVSAANLIKYRKLLKKSKGKMHQPKYKRLVKKLKKLMDEQDSFHSILSQKQ
eukprot:gene11447-4612_t